MDKAADYGSGNFKFESWQGRNILSHTKIYFILNIYCHYCLHQTRCVVAQRIGQLTTNQEIPGWSPCKVVIYCLILSCTLYIIFTAIIIYLNSWPCGSMDKASEYESGDSRLESLQGRNILSHTKLYFIHNICCYYYLPQFVALWLNG